MVGYTGYMRCSLCGLPVEAGAAIKRGAHNKCYMRNYRNGVTVTSVTDVELYQIVRDDPGKVVAMLDAIGYWD